MKSSYKISFLKKKMFQEDQTTNSIAFNQL